MIKIIKNIILSLFPKRAKDHLFKEQKRFSWQTLHEINNEPEVLILEEIFQKHPQLTFFDIGSNKGEYVFASEKYLDPKHIFAFEPNPKLFTRLTALFSTVRSYPIAFSNKNEEVTFKIPTVNGHEDDTLGSIDTGNKLENETSHELVRVPCRTIDSFIAENGNITPGCIKIDVEGFEMAVMEGAADTISSSFPLMLIEIEKRHHQSKMVVELIDKVKNYAPAGQSYEVFYFDSLQHRILPVIGEPSQERPEWGTRNYINNFLFVPAHSVYIADITAINNKLSKLFAKN
ncbi:MAG TPA: FkbM family methyltransferase [Bacteroidia bacterium]